MEQNKCGMKWEGKWHRIRLVPTSSPHVVQVVAVVLYETAYSNPRSLVLADAPVRAVHSPGGQNPASSFLDLGGESPCYANALARCRQNPQ